jgi:hypothetical protein
MVNSKNVILVERLHERTLGNKLLWEKTADAGVFQVVFGVHSIQVSKREVQDNWGTLRGYSFSLEIYDEEGTLLEEIRAGDIEESASQKLKELYELARRQALGVDEILDSLISELEGSSPK